MNFYQDRSVPKEKSFRKVLIFVFLLDKIYFEMNYLIKCHFSNTRKYFKRKIYPGWLPEMDFAVISY